MEITSELYFYAKVIESLAVEKGRHISEMDLLMMTF